jgi:hypothetical protein
VSLPAQRGSPKERGYQNSFGFLVIFFTLIRYAALSEYEDGQKDRKLCTGYGVAMAAPDIKANVIE